MGRFCKKEHLARSGKRWLAGLLSLCLMGTMMPVTARAENGNPGTGLCEHHAEHTTECGYVAPTGESEGNSCTFDCRSCKIEKVEELIAALPEAEEITTENYSEVALKLDAVDSARVELTDAENEQIDYPKYNDAVSRMMELSGQPGANVPMPAVQIYAKMLTGKHITLEVELTDSIESVKTKIQDKEGIAIDKQRLFYAEEELLDGKKLSEYGIPKDTTLCLVVKSSLNTKTINLDATVLRPDGAWSSGGNLVYFGSYDTNGDSQAEPVAYRVLQPSPYTQEAKNSESQTIDSLLLDCDSILLKKPFDADDQKNDGQTTNPNEWKGSDLEAWLGGTDFYAGSVFSTLEKTAIAETALKAQDEYTVGDYNTSYKDYPATNHTFGLSAAEADGLYADNAARKKTGGNAYWWLRSAYSSEDSSAGFVKPDGSLEFNYVLGDHVGVSPALNVNLSKALFASESGTGRSSALASVSDSTATEWKLTLLDSSKTVNVTNEQSVTRQDTTITVPYTYTGSDVSQISVMITDKAYDTNSAQVLYYGALQDVTISETTGTGTFTLPADLTNKTCGTDYYAYIIAEDVNGNKETDYASEPVQITIPAAPDTIKITYYDGETLKQVLVEHVPTDTIAQLKEKIATATGIGAANQQLIFAGQILAETESDGTTPRTLQDYSIQKNSTITLNQIVRQANVTINMPKGGKELNTDASCTTTGIENATLKWTDTINNPVSGTANYYPWCYKAHVIVTPKTGYVLTNDTEVLVNGNGMEEKTLNADGTLTVANSFDSNKDKLTGITAPSPITVANGTAKAADALGLPSQIDITTEEGAVSKADVTWDLNNLHSGSYDPAIKTAQIFEVKGTISYPDEVDVPTEFDDRTVIIKVTASAAKTPVTITGRNAELDFTAGMTIDVSSYFTIDANAGTATYSLVAGPSSGDGTLTGTTLTVNSVGTFNVYCTTAATEQYDSGSANAILTVKAAGGSNSGGGSGGSGSGGGYTPSVPDKSDGSAQPQIKDDNKNAGWTAIEKNIEDTIKKQTEGNTKESVTIEMNGATTVPKSVLDTIKGTDVTVVFDMGDGISWKVNGKDVSGTSADINLGVKTNTTNIPLDVINKVTGENASMQISLEHNGEFGFTATLTLNLEPKNKGLYANLFYYDPKAEKGKELEYICADEIDEKGNADLTFTHASDYTIVIDKEPMVTEKLDAPKKGTLMTDSKTKMVYKVTKSGTTGGTVQFVKTGNTKTKTLTIPATVTFDGITYKVTSIAADACKNNKTITTVTIGKNVTSIGSGAFSGCIKLKKVTIGKSVTTIGSKAFYKCTSLTGITIPSKVKKIGNYAFKGCSKLKIIVVKTTRLTAKTVSEKAFSGISTSTVVKVPKSKAKAYQKLLVKKGLGKKVMIKELL